MYLSTIYVSRDLLNNCYEFKLSHDISGASTRPSSFSSSESTVPISPLAMSSSWLLEARHAEFRD